MNANAPLRCARCHAELSPGARFCASCGKEQLASAPTVLASLASTEIASTPLASTEMAETPRRFTPLPPMRILPGTVLAGIYEVEDVIGEGGMGVVYRTRDRSRDRAVAVKCLHTNLSGDAEVRRRFVREAKVLRSFTHPNVVATYDFIEHEHLLAIVMELVEGMTLVQYIEKWRRPRGHGRRPPAGHRPPRSQAR